MEAPSNLLNLRNPFLPSNRAALIPRDSCSVFLAAGQWADGGVFSFHTDQVLTEAATGCSTPFPQPFLRRKWFVEPFSVRKASRSWSSYCTAPVHTLTVMMCPLGLKPCSQLKDGIGQSAHTAQTPLRIHFLGCYANLCGNHCFFPFVVTF